MPHEQAVLERKPPTDVAMSICIEAWRDLNTERALGYGAVGMIPWSRTMAWCRHHGLEVDNANLLWQVIQQLDAARAEREASKAAL